MKVTQNRILESFQRAQSFLDNNAAQLATIPQSAPRLALDGIVTDLLGSSSTQSLSKSQSTSSINTTAALREALLVQHMRPIATIAKDNAIAITDVSGVTMPSAKTTNINLVADAIAMATDITPFAQTFIANGLPNDFIAQLQAAAAALNGAITNTGTIKSNRVEATSSAATLERQGRLKLKVISAQVQAALLGNTSLLAKWENAKRVTPQRSSTSTTAPSPTPASTPTPAATTTTTSTPVTASGSLAGADPADETTERTVDANHPDHAEVKAA